MSRRVLVAIPAWNEQETVAAVVADALEQPQVDRVLVIDDGSGDDTPRRARQGGAHTISLPFNVGVGGAMRTAFLYAERNGFDTVIQLDADGQHLAESVPDLLAGLDGASVVIGSRFGDERAKARGPRRWAMWILAKSLSRITKANLTDTTSGCRAADAQAVQLYAKHYPAEYLGDTVESLVIAARAGLTVREVPVPMQARQGGKPSQGSVLQSLYLGRALLALFSAWTRRRDLSVWA